MPCMYLKSVPVPCEGERCEKMCMVTACDVRCCHSGAAVVYLGCSTAVWHACEKHLGFSLLPWWHGTKRCEYVCM